MMEARLILAMSAQGYKLMLEPDQKVVPMQVITVKPRGPVRMRVEQRAEVHRGLGVGGPKRVFGRFKPSQADA
jgi:hypothetical protein